MRHQDMAAFFLRQSDGAPGTACKLPEPHCPPLPTPTLSSSLTDSEKPMGVPLQSGGVQPLRAGNGVCEDGLQVAVFSY